MKTAAPAGTAAPPDRGWRFVGAGWPLAALASLLLFAATVCPTVPFGDGGELIAAAQRLGVAHPPGYPLYTFLGWLALKIPLGEPALRMNLLSALLGALACGAAARLVRRWTGSSLAGAAAGLVLAASSAFWSVATVAEVYTLHLLLTLLLLDGATAAGGARDASGRARGVVAAAVALGLGLAHHPTIVLALPAAMVLAWPAAPHSLSRSKTASSWRVWGAAAVLAAVIPALLDLTLLLRSISHPGAEWGRPETLEALFRHVSAAQYGAYDLGLRGLARTEAWGRSAAIVASGFAGVAPALALLGVGLWRAPGGGRSRRAPAFAAILLTTAGFLFALAYETEDVEVFLLPSFLGVALLSGLGIAWLGSLGGRRGKILALAAALAAVAVPAAVNLPRRNLAGADGAAAYGRDMLAGVPRDGVLFVEGDDAFILAYLTGVLGERPDVTIYDRKGNLFRDLAAERAAGPFRTDRIAIETRFIEEETARASPRPILFMSWPGYDLPAGLRFEPVGLLYRVRRGDEPKVEDRGLWAGYRGEAVARQARRSGDPFALTVAATYPLMRGERALFLGDRPAAEAAFDSATELSGPSETILNTLGTIRGRLGDYPRAIAAFEAAVRAKPVSMRALNNLGLARSLAGDRAGALEAWKRSLALDSGQADVADLVRRTDSLR